MIQRQSLKKEYKQLEQIRQLIPRMEKLSDRGLAGLTKQFKNRFQEGETLEQLLPEVYAAVCEADRRILGKMPYDVQILGAIAMHEGCLTEMHTGEGKTLTATMPLYLNALTGKSCLLLTANEYLAKRDAEEMGKVYTFMGLSCVCGAATDAQEKLTNDDKRRIYDSDIVYTTHGALGFDYLFNQLVTTVQDRFMRAFYYVIIDEADTVLLDAAQTPLVIAGSPRTQSNLYEMTDFFVSTLQEGEDYLCEDGAVYLTEKGDRYAESYFQIDNFYSRKHFELHRHVIQALQAHTLYEPEENYLITGREKKELVLLDQGTGRLMPGVKLRGGMQQALETKEKVPVSQENRSVASITYQNLFKLFPKIAGMSGTLLDNRRELRKTYKTRIVSIPTNKACIRRDLPDQYFRTNEEQVKAALLAAEQLHEAGRPVLMVANDIYETEWISELLTEGGIAHSVLNANNAAWEAEMIAAAGQKTAVTVATSMAGRGTDIRLGEGVRELGGLAVLGIGRMRDIRLEKQARGRAGRQGDPGSSQFFVSLEDDIVTECGPKRVDYYTEEGHRISRMRMKRMINGAQKLCSENAEFARQQSVDYDKIMQRQRYMLYQVRDELLEGGTLKRKRFYEISKENIRLFVNKKKEINPADAARYILDNISYRPPRDNKQIYANKKQLQHYLMDCVEAACRRKRREIRDRNVWDAFVRKAALQAIDDAWVEQVDYLQQLRAAVAGRAFAGRNVLQEYQTEAYKSFEKMVRQIRLNIMRNVLLSSVKTGADGRVTMILP